MNPQHMASEGCFWRVMEEEYMKCAIRNACSAKKRKRCLRAADCGGHSAGKQRCVWSGE